jgi:hypothetical protein
MAWKRSSVRSRSGPPNKFNFLDKVNGRTLTVCVTTRHSGAIGNGFHLSALDFRADVAAPLQDHAT